DRRGRPQGPAERRPPEGAEGAFPLRARNVACAKRKRFLSTFSLTRFRPTPQGFRDAPRLGDAAARRERLLRVKDLAERADAGFAQLADESLQKAPGSRPLLRLDLDPGVEERTDEPRPHRSLMIGGIAGTQVAIVLRLVIGMAGRQRAQSHRR